QLPIAAWQASASGRTASAALGSASRVFWPTRGLPAQRPQRPVLVQADRDRVGDVEVELALRLGVEEPDEHPRRVAALDERGGEEVGLGGEGSREADVPRTPRRRTRDRPGAVVAGGR